MKHTQGKWSVEKLEISHNNKHHKTEYYITNDSLPPSEVVAKVRKRDANLIASSPELLQLLKDILAEVRPEISRVNSDAGCTIFNPVATETIDMAKDLIAKAEGK